MTTEQKTRVAIVRCDSHAYWYGPFLDEADPLTLGSYDKEAPTRTGVACYFQKVGNPRALRVEREPGFVISKLFDRIPEFGYDEQGVPKLQYGTYPGRAQAFSATFASRPQVCETIEEAAQDVDVAFISDSSSPGDGGDHLELARPFLERGIPTFVDKPFAATLADAREMVRLAQKHGTALMNASLLGHNDVGRFFRRRFDELGEPGLLVVKGVGFGNSGVLHGVALAQSLFDYGVEAVECMGAKPDPTQEHWNKGNWRYYIEHLLLHYPDGRQAMVMNTSNAWYPQTSEFYCSAYSKLGVIHSPGIGDNEFLSGGTRIVKLFRQMADTGQPPIPYEHILEPIAILEAARIAQQEGRRVAISEVWDGSTD